MKKKEKAQQRTYSKEKITEERKKNPL